MLSALPGAELVEKGLADLARREETIESLLVSIGAPRLQDLGLAVAGAFPDADRRLYELLSADDADDAHSRYNALLRQLGSYARAAECAS